MIPKERLGEQFLMGYQIAEGIGAAGLAESRARIGKILDAGLEAERRG